MSKVPHQKHRYHRFLSNICATSRITSLNLSLTLSLKHGYVFIAGFEDGTSEDLRFEHLPDGRVTCLQCGKTLFQLQNAKRHYSTYHQINPPAKCKLCGKICKNELAREAHMRRVHGITPAMMRNAIESQDNDSD